MKTFLLLIHFLLFSSAIFGQTVNDEEEVRLVFKKMHDCWDKHDYSYSKCDVFDSNALFINPVGMYWKSKAEITSGLHFLGEVRFKYLTVLKDTILALRFLAPTVALVIVNNVDQVNKNFTMPGGAKGEKGEISEGMQSYTLVKENAGWKITSVHITHVETNTSH